MVAMFRDVWTRVVVVVVPCCPLPHEEQHHLVVVFVRQTGDVVDVG